MKGMLFDEGMDVVIESIYIYIYVIDKIDYFYRYIGH